MRLCRSCGSDISAKPINHFLCPSCYGDAARRLKTGGDRALLTVDRVDQLIRFTKPELQNRDADAASINDWLKGVRRSLLGNDAGGANV
jgi:hypothetical protein